VSEGKGPEVEANLSREQIHRLKGHLGAGNPAGRFWFIGMEEAGGSDHELRVRADHFDPIIDHANGRKLINPEVDLRALTTQVWPAMCRIVARVGGDPRWRDRGRVKDYLEHHLGRLDGDTFLTEVLPLPKRSVSDWPYKQLWNTQADYISDVIEGRIELLRNLYQESAPTYTFCYGNKFWDYHKKVFSDLKFETLIDGYAEIGVRGHSVVVLTRFFNTRNGRFTIPFIDALISAIEQRVGVLP